MNIFNELKIKSLKQLILTFSDEQKCINFLEKIFWDGNPVSPFDKNSKVYKCKGNKYKCKNTGKYFTIKNIGLFKNSNLKLIDWFIAIWLFTSHKGGLSSMQLQRELNVTQKTAWFILKRLRECSKFENKHTLSGEVEIDETYVGGKNKNRHADKKVKRSQGRSFKDKVPVLGMIQRGGKVVAHVVESVSAEQLEPIIFKTIDAFETVYTDEWKAYNNLHEFYNHSIVNHGKKEYVNGNTSTNCIENFWGNLKRGIIGVYRVVSRKHLQKYIFEFVFRHNTRKMSPSERFVYLLSNIKGCNFSYKQLMTK
ncbi:ISXO2-like transposase domain-containing protein [Chryseobacterium profundimaris]|uniref:ISXO2-like transposase domain-containing protein n=2 Tax=Chryseobacterium profundimaris TaxID=1387275 RepID=A0ABY1NIW2_9FLAO|nr:IS1595 family transposase [Chryseobacterium profundimaris]SMP10785.1 ISXO2-like transposase domain-containing protein [Chryseobacterium profundimaris]